MEGRENTISCIQGILRKRVKEAGQKKEVLRQLRNPGPVYIKLMFMRYTGVWLKIFLRLALEQEAGSNENKTQIGWGCGHGIQNQELLKGWNRIDGIWYCLDTETGVWIEKPSMTSEAACRLLENKLLEMGMYQDEEEPLQFKVDYENNQMVQVSVGYEDKPDVFHRINTYEIDKKKGTADPVVGDKEFSLW